MDPSLRARACAAGLLALAGAACQAGAPPQGGRATAADLAMETQASSAGPARADELFERGSALVEARRYAEARLEFERAAELARASGDLEIEVESLAQVARMHSLARQPAEGLAWLERAEALAAPERPRGFARARLVRGVYEREAGRREAATAIFAELYEYCMARGLPERAIDAAHMAAIAGSPAEQIEWARRGIAAAEAAGDAGWLAVLWNNLGATCEDMADFDGALAAYENARRYHAQGGDAHALAVADWAVGRALRRGGRPAEARAPIEAALAAFEARRAEPGELEWIGYACWELGLIELDLGRAAEGRAALERAGAALGEAGLASAWPEGWAELERDLARARR